MLIRLCNSKIPSKSICRCFFCIFLCFYNRFILRICFYIKDDVKARFVVIISRNDCKNSKCLFCVFYRVFDNVVERVKNCDSSFSKLFLSFFPSREDLFSTTHICCFDLSTFDLFERESSAMLIFSVFLHVILNIFHRIYLLHMYNVIHAIFASELCNRIICRLCFDNNTIFVIVNIANFKAMLSIFNRINNACDTSSTTFAKSNMIATDISLTRIRFISNIAVITT